MGLLLRPNAGFAMAHEFQRNGAAIGELFQFGSGLYFRGKLAYARRFARPPRKTAGALVIVPGRGLLDVETVITADDLRAIAQVPVDVRDKRYREPLERDVRELAGKLGKRGEAVLLGSIATGKYADVLLGGGLLLRCVRAEMELPYESLRGAIRHGPRPPKLPRY
ncbi:MAG: hypothetical protein E6J88_15720 [Deltaproteobacteria bacterium]|nr:MAG: hypothetical protein E6J88_15720 [Deltaproteobacteria bacterium]